jgi:hypothetical protein
VLRAGSHRNRREGLAVASAEQLQFAGKRSHQALGARRSTLFIIAPRRAVQTDFPVAVVGMPVTLGLATWNEHTKPCFLLAQHPGSPGFLLESRWRSNSDSACSTQRRALAQSLQVRKVPGLGSNLLGTLSLRPSVQMNAPLPKSTCRSSSGTTL